MAGKRDAQDGYTDGETGEHVSIEAIQEAVRGATDKYLKREESSFRGFACVKLTEGVRLGDVSFEGESVGLWPRKSLNAGLYFMMPGDGDTAEKLNGQGEDASPVILAFSLSDDTLKRIEEEAREAIDAGMGERVRANDGTELIKIEGPAGQSADIAVSFKPMYAENGKALTLNDVIIWAAIQEARKAGNETLEKALLVMTYAKYARTEKAELPTELPRQDAKRPTKHFQTLSKVSNDLWKVRNGETTHFDMSGTNESHVYTVLSLNYEGDDISLSRPIDSYDESVHNAVATLWAAGNRTITPAQVAKVLTGKDKPGDGSINDVIVSMNKQRCTLVTIDFSAEMRGKTGELDGERFTAEQCIQETYMLDATKTHIRTTRGNVVVGYTVNSAPIFYLHDEITGQITSYPQSLLKATAKAVSSTKTNITMRDYLIIRISRMKNPHTKTARNIVYDTVFEHIGRGNTSPKDRRRMIESARNILDALQTEGFITGWSEYTEGGSSHRTKGVTIETRARK